MELKELIEDSIMNYPLVLLSIKDKSIIDMINNYLPYSVGIEIECMQSPNFNIERFKSIPNIMDVDCDSGEQRFRIPNGLVGLICLYNICEELAINSELNPLSGHHYHIDMTNTYHLLNEHFVKTNQTWILNELDSWNYIGTYNTRLVQFNTCANWVRFQREFKTAEFRIGNMTFDYTIIVKRLIHACNIIQRLNKQLVNAETIVYQTPNFEQLKNSIKYSKSHSKLQYLINQLALLNKDTHNITAEEQKQVIKNRVIKI